MNATTTSSSDEYLSPLARVRRVLVVDGDHEHQLLTRTILRMLELPADVAKTGAAALEAMASGSYDLMIMDISLPDMSGHELVRALRRSPRTRATRVLAHSVYVLPGDVDRAFAAGCEGFIERPYTLRGLERAIGALFA